MRYAELKKHTEPIVGMVSTTGVEGSTLYSVAADNCICFWDVDSQSCMKKIAEEDKSEPTAGPMLLPIAKCLVTGHEGSEIKLWSLYAPNEPPVVLHSPTGKSKAHTNSITCIDVIEGKQWLHHLIQEKDNRGVSNSSNNMQGAAGNEDINNTNNSSSSSGYNPLFNEPFEMIIAGGYDCRLSFWRVIAGDVKGAPPTYKFDHGYRAHEFDDDEILCLCYNFQVKTNCNYYYLLQVMMVVRFWSEVGMTKTKLQITTTIPNNSK